MGAHPKNKITRAERGKRRAGNTPSLKKDYKVAAVPLHKRGLVSSILRKVGIVKGAAPVAEKPETEKKAVQPAAKPAPVEKVEKAPKAASQAKVAPVKRTQHKG
jgi:hypothetical protein